MPSLNIEFTEDEYNKLVEAKLKLGLHKGKELNWHEFFIMYLNKKLKAKLDEKGVFE
jgi:hypothetical protein